MFGLRITSALCLSTFECLVDSQAVFLSLMYFKRLVLLPLELFCFWWSTQFLVYPGTSIL